MIEIHNKQILIDGEPRVVMAGEIHYFRVPRDEWERRTSAQGGRLQRHRVLHSVALHELPDGTIDVAGETRPSGTRCLHRPVRGERPVVHRPAGSVRDGRADERGDSLPASTASTPR